jgi:hypothetical protein
LNNSKNIKGTWFGIKQLVTLKQSKSNFPNKITINNSKITDPINIANSFNKYFASIGPNLSEIIPNVNCSIHDYLGEQQIQSVFLIPTTPDEIEREIDGLNASKATGQFSIPIRLLKILKLLLSKPLSHLFNISFSSGLVPDKLKIAKVIPVYKKGSRLEMSNYRPISLLSIFNKILENLMYSRLMNFIKKHNILFENQFGFHSNHSTTQAILQITDKIQESTENKLYSCGIFLDLSKAFDTVNHYILLQKLDHYGIRGVVKEWFRSYLDNRKQFVSIGSASSELEEVRTGVPQSSVLGPLLFLIYINDFCNSAKSLDFHLFADDSNLFLAHKNLHILEISLNKYLYDIKPMAMC